MKLFFGRYKLLAVVVCMVLLGGCKQPETVIVDEDPTAVAPSDTTDEEIKSNEASFRKLVVGEYNTIPTMDPLFADNATSMRAIQLVFEGLVRLDSTGSVVPGLAERWEITDDSLTYTFTLRDNIYYHDNDVFSTGTGRKFTSDDVKFVFERMAHAGVPPKAAHLFMGIQGFEPYFQEQREVYLPSSRKLEEVTGIKTPTDSTVTFELIYEDAEFLRKLATPLAVIYPQEAVQNTRNSFAPVGTGPFQFSSKNSDSTHVFSKFQNYYAASRIELNRVDIVTSNSESALFRSMSSNDIHVIPQLGPQTIPVVLTSDGKLQQSYAERYNLHTTEGGHEYVLRYNPAAGLSEENAQMISSVASFDTGSYFDRFPRTIVTSESDADTTASSQVLSDIDDQLLSVYSDDPFVKTYLGSLSKALNQNGVKLQMAEIRAPSRNTELFFTQNYSLIPDTRWNNYPALFSFRVSQAALQRSDITDLTYNQHSWWFDLRGVSLPAPENLN